MKSKLLLFAFWVFFLLDVTGTTSGVMTLHYLAKPLLLPSLMYMFWLNTRKARHPLARLMMTGLFFSWVGDILLMFEQFHFLFFVGGLISFLTTHVLYIIYFIKTPKEHESYFRKRPVMLLPGFVYTIELLNILFPHLGGLKIPVAIYAVVITLMWIMSVWQYQKIEFRTSLIFIIGASSFVISDSILAINKFYEAVPLSNIWIMLTYCLAQYLIVLGAKRIDETIRISG